METIFYFYFTEKKQQQTNKTLLMTLSMRLSILQLITIKKQSNCEKKSTYL